MLGALVITPFLTQASSSIIGSRIDGQIIQENYACESGVEHAIWRLNSDGLAEQLPDVGDSAVYQLPHDVNNLLPTITVTKEAGAAEEGKALLLITC